MGPTRRQSVLLFLGTFLLYLTSGDYVWQNLDTASTVLPAWRLATEHTMALDDFTGRGYWLVESEGRWVSGRFPGAILLAIPFYWLMGDAGAAVGQVPSAVPSVVASSAAAAGAVSLMFVVLRSLVSNRAALGGALLLGLGTATWSVSASALWTHAPSQLALVLALLGLARQRYALAGLALGAAALSRPHLVMLAGVLVVGICLETRRLRPPLLVAAGTCLGVAGLLAWNWQAFGRLTLLGGYAGLDPTLGDQPGALLLAENVVLTAISPARGLLWLCPFLVLLTPGLRSGWRGAPVWVRSAAVGGLAYLCAQFWLADYSGGHGFYGNRMVLETGTACAPLLALAHREWTQRSPLRRTLFAVLSAVAVATHAAGAYMYSGQRQEPDALRLFALPSLVHQYGALVLYVAAGTAVVTLVAAGLLARTPPGSAAPVEAPRPQARAA